MPQLNLNFNDIPIPETCLWEQLDDQQKRIVIETLADEFTALRACYRFVLLTILI